MTLPALIRKREPSKPATAIPATAATEEGRKAGTVATVATVAVANLPREQSATDAPKVGASNTPSASRWWLIHYPDREPVQLTCCPPATHAGILAGQPNAIAAEPFEPIQRQPTAPLTADDEAAIRQWLAQIEETDPAIIADVLNQCGTDAEARDYWMRRAGEDL